MAKISTYKQYGQRNRRAVLESDFSKGMMSTSGAVEEGYLRSLVNFTFEKETKTLVPRRGIRPVGVIFPDLASPPNADYLDEKTTIKAVKPCVEEGLSYNQFLLGGLKGEDNRLGELWAVTSRPGAEKTTIKEAEYSYDIDYTVGFGNPDSHKCYFYSADAPRIHDISMVTDDRKRSGFPVGTFAFGNSYYFFGEDVEGTPGLFRTVFDGASTPPRYKFEAVNAKDLSVSEAVTYGYNMLKNEDAYDFMNRHASSIIQLEGVLPYDPITGTLLMTPKRNQSITFKCFYDVINERKFDIKWEWRETTSSNWTLLYEQKGIVFGENIELVADFKPPAVDMMLRISAYPYADEAGTPTATVSDTVEKAITVGFDFSVENYGTANALSQETYDLTTATGMATWNGRIVVWGVPKDPTILFISDYNEPAYFPYPNNITVFDSPIIHTIEFMGTLIVFTTNKLYQVTLAEDGNSWNTTVLQSNLNIDVWDKHLIQPVRNMLFFKSGNYYYMMVPRAESTTGKLVLAPITNPITSFFDKFSLNVQNILKDTYDYTGQYELLTYYNYLDYEDIHNIYAFKFDDSAAILHVDVIYNTVSRTWKIWVFESAQMLHPFNHNATETGMLVTTSLLDVREINSLTTPVFYKFIQMFTLDKMTVRDYYIPSSTLIVYDKSFVSVVVDSTNEALFVPIAAPDISYTDEVLSLPFRIVNNYVDNTLIFSSTADYYYGFYKPNITKVIDNVYNNIEYYYTFRNYQFIDTGYINDEIQTNKRYRELQLQINNLDQKNMNFGMEYMLDGSPRKLYYLYDTDQSIDEFNPEYGVVYVDSTPFIEVELDSIDKTNQWSIDQNLIPEISLWKIRVAISGKGSAPRLKLFSRNEKRFELLGVNWISKIMHMR